MEVQFPEEPRFPAWKIPFLQYLLAVIMVVLLGGYWRLQVTQHKKYVERSERNRTRDLPVIAPRGRILDRDGHVLVDNRPAFSVLLSRDGPEKLSSERIEEIARGLEIDPADLTEQLQQAKNLPRFQPLVIKESATLQDVAFVESHRSEYPELDLIQTPQRFYPKHHVASAMLGYVGDVSAETIARTGKTYQPGDVVGKTGIEKEYNATLAGRDGVRRVIVNSRGQEMGALATVDPKPGRDLRLTIDLNLQLTAEQELGSQDGAVVAVDPRTGQVLAMVSQPAFDPNQFAHHISTQEWKQLVSDPAKPLMNKAIQAQLAPGSIFKIVTSVAALETGTVRPNFTVYCPGYATFYGHTYHDWSWVHHRGHGTVDLHEAIVHSCDVYFYTVGKMVGIDKLAYFAKHLGLGAKTGIDLPGEEPGVVPTPAWVEKYFRHKWYAGETISVAIGQGAVAVTPLQIAYMIGGVASGGVFYRPHLVFYDELQRLGLDPQGSNPKAFPLSPTTVAAVDRGMWGVVNEGGTGARARVAGLDIAGKTGTAQVVSVRLQRSEHRGNYKDNAWFVGFAPSTHPEVVVAVLVMHGGHSSVAVPIASAVIKAYYAEKQQIPLRQPGKEPEIARGATAQSQPSPVKASVIP
ncbi:MAG TPA: penicillin-binding protein 2 [Terriglobia bacterium]|nr:penicillin-binding protein 2 [Terriglobia bacterium]